MKVCPKCGSANKAEARFCPQCGTALTGTLATGMLPSQSLLRQGRYLIVETVGRGGMGAVYKALDIQLGKRVVAIKEMSQQGLNQQDLQDAISAFTREAEMLVHLKHPSLPHIYEQFADGGRRYLVMEFIEGETLEDRLERFQLQNRTLPVEQVLTIAIQLCDVLGYLHKQQPSIIFRDLKPGNIMLGQQDQVYLIDFGIARFFKLGQSKDTIALGSQGYAPPEQYRGATSPRSDLYSLGATLHQLLTGDDPSLSLFHFRTFSVNNPALEKLVLSMVELDEKLRPQSAQEVAAALQKLTVRPVSPPVVAQAKTPVVVPSAIAPQPLVVPAGPGRASISKMATLKPMTVAIILSPHADDQRVWRDIFNESQQFLTDVPKFQFFLPTRQNGSSFEYLPEQHIFDIIKRADTVFFLLSDHLVATPEGMNAIDKSVEVQKAKSLSFFGRYIIVEPYTFEDHETKITRKLWGYDTVDFGRVLPMQSPEYAQCIATAAKMLRYPLTGYSADLNWYKGKPEDMNLLQWLISRMYGSPIENYYFHFKQYRLETNDAVGKDLQVLMYNRAKNKVVGQYAIYPLHSPNVLRLVRALDRTATDPEAIVGQANEEE